jgi:hypothetical protein
MRKACSIHGGEKDCIQVFVGKPEGMRPLGRPELGGRIILKWILEKIRWGCMDWIDLAQGSDQWRALVNTIMNLWFP